MSDELTYNPHDSLEDTLARLATGIPLEDVLAAAGEDAEWLGPLLEMATEVGQLKQAIPLARPEASLQRMLAHAEELASIISPETPSQSWWRTILSNFAWSERQPALIGSPLLIFFAIGLLVTFLVGGLFGGGLALAAEDSLPGHSLYGLKRFGETVRLSLASGVVQRERLLQDFGERRRQEVHLLLERGEEAKVVFVSRIESLTATEVTVDGLVAKLTRETEITGQLAVGARVRIEGITRPPDSLIALALTVLEPAPPSPTPTVTSTPTATATSLTPTPTNTRALESTSDTIRLTPTSTPTVTSPIQPTPSDIPGEAGDDTSGSTSPSPTATRSTPSVGPTSTTVPTENDNTSGNGEGNDDNSGSGSGDDDGNDNSGSDGDDNDGDDNSGPGSGDGDRDDNSDSGSGSSKSDDDDDKSGSGKSERSGKDDD